jgi:hypothetical protein
VVPVQKVETMQRAMLGDAGLVQVQAPEPAQVTVTGPSVGEAGAALGVVHDADDLAPARGIGLGLVLGSISLGLCAWLLLG